MNLQKLYLLAGIMMLLTQALVGQTFYKWVGTEENFIRPREKYSNVPCWGNNDVYTSTDVCEWGIRNITGYDHYPDLGILPNGAALATGPAFRSDYADKTFAVWYYYNENPTYSSSERHEANYIVHDSHVYSGHAVSIGVYSSSILYLAADSLWRRQYIISYLPINDPNPTNARIIINQSKNMGSLPPDLQNPTAMGLRNGEMYIATQNAIAKVDTINAMNSKVIWEIPEDFPIIDGLFTLNYECGRSITYAVANHQWFKESIFYELDFDRKEFIELCSFEGFQVNGFASSAEWEILECPIIADLDGPSTSQIDFSPPPTCNFRQYIADTLIHLYARSPVDSVRVAIHGGVNTAIDKLTFQNIPGIQIREDQPGELLLLNEGSATAEDFEEALQGIWYEYQLIASVPITKKVDIILYADTLVSGIAQSTLRLGVDNPVQLTHTVDSVTCYGGSDGRASLKVPRGSGPFSFQWPDGSDQSVREDLSEGQYIVTVTDAQGCTGLDTLEVFAPEVPLSVSIEIPGNPVCDGAGSLIATASGGVGPYQYAWSHGDTVSNPTALSAGAYSLTLTDAKGCEAVASAILDSRPTFRRINTVAICQGESYEYEGLMLTRDTLICDTVRVDNACDSLFCFELQVRPVFERAVEASICHGEQFEFYGSLLSSDTSLCITRRAPNGCDSTICLTLQVLRPQSEHLVQICRDRTFYWRGQPFSEPGLYTDTIENMFGCDSVLILRLEYVPLPELNIEQSGSFCAGDDEVRLSVADNFSTYYWSSGSRSNESVVTRPDRYFVNAFDENGCYTSDTIYITEAGIEEISWSGEDPTCYGYSDGSFTINSLGGGQLPILLSINDEPFRPGRRAENLKAGIYTARVEDAVGCRKEVRFRLREPPQPYIDLPMDISIGLGDSVLLEPVTNLQTENILWTPPDYLSCDDCLTPLAFPVQSAQYQLELSDTAGCTAHRDIRINVDRRSSLYVPNSFSPNGDGINDELIPYGGNSVASIRLFRIFDRWGNLLFERKDFLPGRAGWNGRARGEELPKGVYLYQLEVERIDGEVEVLMGDVMLLR